MEGLNKLYQDRLVADEERRTDEVNPSSRPVAFFHVLVRSIVTFKCCKRKR